MFSKYLSTAVIAASIAFTPATRVAADAGDFVAGAIIGGIIGHAATKQNQRKKAATKRYYKKPARPRIPATQEGRQIQSSLNYFGFNAGGVDGQLGRKSRDAISRYQAYMGYPSTGQLTPFEQDLLVTSYNRAQAGGYAVNQQIATSPDGTRGLLKQYRAELAGAPAIPQAAAAAPMTTVVVAPQPVAPVPGTTTTTVTSISPITPVTPEPQAPAQMASTSPLPNFLGGGAQQSLASHCNTISLLTNTNGGFTKAEQMTDASFALNEQFCLARTYAIAQGEDLVSKVQGFTPQQIEAQCEAFGPAMKDHVAALSLKPQQAVVQDVASFILTTGMSPAQLNGTAKICLGVGYRTDNMDVALGSSLLLFAMGEGVYGELMGHHLAQGFGTAKRTDMALVWYEQGLTAIENGAQPVFAPGQPERNDLIRKASLQLNGAPQAKATMSAPIQPVSGLPSFSVSE
ncbi:peptidoglycan-binding domain-containing protein [Thalassococcus sp. S3]|uniref:peptidoglycan-binding domain-containing protein n=1 Tax=Thalassococcus sp. S3 TaxID=2017482 RepID=UPI00102469EA|nr:peptidoglycan-binding domain-containing protein [Thalassococcus sp. S3]QBF32351.1 hypothetical protein CFI11_14180 [Thalassococcus sp. S3]